mmetsp:Transcript_21819/g.64362  ORF Transcript_21819/g.64362 Transcript_21819/m.64362 type:complete len:214 (+) Transcript_21819:456-1097(+)
MGQTKGGVIGPDGPDRIDIPGDARRIAGQSHVGDSPPVEQRGRRSGIDQHAGGRPAVEYDVGDVDPQGGETHIGLGDLSNLGGGRAAAPGEQRPALAATVAVAGGQRRIPIVVVQIQTPPREIELDGRELIQETQSDDPVQRPGKRPYILHGARHRRAERPSAQSRIAERRERRGFRRPSGARHGSRSRKGREGMVPHRARAEYHAGARRIDQ